MSTDLEPVDNLYDEEIKIIDELQRRLIYKYGDKKPTIQNLKDFEKEVQGRFEDIGFEAHLNAVNFLQDVLNGVIPPSPLEIVVVGRLNKIGEFDHDKKAYEIKKSRAAGGE